MGWEGESVRVGMIPALPAATETPPSAPAVAGITSGQCSEPVVRKQACEPAKKRVRHGQSAATLEHLTNAVNNWLNKTGEFLSEDPALPIKDYCALVNISWKTFRKYVCSDVGKRRCIGAVAGNRAILPESTSQFAVDVMRRRDRGNDAMTKREVVDLLQDLAPHLCRKQCEQAFDRNVIRIEVLIEAMHDFQCSTAYTTYAPIVGYWL